MPDGILVRGPQWGNGRDAVAEIFLISCSH